jgi:hypothetical protein
MAETVCTYCLRPKPDMLRVNDQYICYECAVARSDCNRGRR